MADGEDIGPGARREGSVRLLLPEHVRRMPADLAAVVGLVALTDLVALLPVVRETPLRVVFGLPFVLFVPGYAFVAALFPEAGAPPTGVEAEGDVNGDGERAVGTRDRGIDGIERVALSFGLSIAIVPLIGLVLNFTPWGIRLVPILLSVSAFTLVATAIAVVRRWELPPEDRFHVPYREWYAAGRAELFEPDTRADAALNVLLALSVVLAVASVGYAVAVPKQGEAFTEFYLLTEDGSGDLVAADYPTEFVRGESGSLVVGIGNHEHEPVTYSVVVELHNVRVANNSTLVLEERELRRFNARLEHNETWHRSHNVTPTMVGDRLRLTYLLYRGDPPGNPTIGNAYRELHLWVNVTDPSTTDVAAPIG